MRLFVIFIFAVIIHTGLAVINGYESVIVGGLSYLIANRICDDLDKEENLEK